MARSGNKDRGILELPKGSGNWWVRVWINGKEKRYRASNKTQAKTLYAKIKGEQREGIYFPEKYEKKRVAFRTLANEYLKYADVHHKRKGDDKPRLEKWIDAFGDQDAATITPGQVEQILLAMQQEGYASATIVRYLVVLKACLNRAVRNDLLKTNPIQKVKPPKVNNVIVRYLTPEQEEALLHALPERFRPLILTALHTGMRQGELLRLRWTDIDFNAGVITVNQTKAGESRRVLMNTTVWTILDQLKKTNTGAESWVFRSTAGTALNGRNVRRAFDLAVTKAKLAPFRFHDLRHTFASRLAMQGANDRTLQELLGHKTSRMILRYAHLAPTHLWQAIEGLTNTQGDIKPDRATKREIRRQDTDQNPISNRDQNRD
jgi:integrase